MNARSERLKKVAVVAVMVALEIVLHRLLSIKTPIVMIHLGFLPIIAVAIAYGPIWAGVMGALAELLGSLVFPVGAYFPGFTLTALLTGIIFGLFIYHSRYSFFKGCVASVIITLFLTLLLDTFWLYAFFNTNGDGYLVLMAARLVKAGVMLVLQIASIPLLHKVLKSARIIEPVA